MNNYAAIHLEKRELKILLQTFNTLLRVPFVQTVKAPLDLAPLEDRLSKCRDAAGKDIKMEEADLRNAIRAIDAVRAEYTQYDLHTYIGCWPADLDALKAKFENALLSAAGE
jgi:hypothetical protein